MRPAIERAPEPLSIATFKKYPTWEVGFRCFAAMLIKIRIRIRMRILPDHCHVAIAMLAITILVHFWMLYASGPSTLTLGPNLRYYTAA